MRRLADLPLTRSRTGVGPESDRSNDGVGVDSVRRPTGFNMPDSVQRPFSAPLPRLIVQQAREQLEDCVRRVAERRIAFVTAMTNGKHRLDAAGLDWFGERMSTNPTPCPAAASPDTLGLQVSGRWKAKPRRAWCLARPVVGIALGVASGACADAVPVTEPGVRLGLAQVTEAVAANLGADGHFVLPASVTNPPGQISEAQARAIATRYVRDVARSKLSDWTATHGAPIDAAALVPCDRALYAANPYIALQGPKISELTLRTFGAHWIVPMCGQLGELQVVVSFSALATELADDIGAERLPWERAGVMSFGIPIGTPASMYSPEGAAFSAFTAAGKRASSVPQLIMTPMPMVPALVRWRLSIEGPITVVGTHSAAVRQITTVRVGFGTTFKSSGLLDDDPQAPVAKRTWLDPVTNQPFDVVMSPLAPQSLEIVTRRQP